MTRILLVEDDEDIRPLIEEILLDEGYQVEATSTVAGASELLKAHTFDLLLTDGRLPDGNGLMIAKKVSPAGMKVVLFTGYLHDFASEDLAQYTVLTKPAGLETLAESISSIVPP
jgi:two-component system response regulator HydG